MARIYLLTSAVLYALFALACTLGHTTTARLSGYLALNDSGWVEYLVVYGGMSFGLAAFCAYTAFRSRYYRIALLLSLFVYLPVVLYRVSMAWLYWPVSRLTLVIAVLEIMLLLGAAVILAANARPGQKPL